jgi:ribosomal protein S18 acetylase RimI-like enzyme
MKPIDWEERSVASEIEYSKALKSTPVEYPDFIHLLNPFVPWSGDFNRAVGVKLTDFHSFKAVVSQVENIHKENSMDRPDRYDIYPPALNTDPWNDHLEQRGYRLETAVFFAASTLDGILPAGFSLVIPGGEEYIEWFCRVVQERGYFDEDWFQKVKPLQLNFASIFQPYWFMKDGIQAGWVYCANFGKYARLFEVEINPEFRGKGIGRVLLDAIRIQMGKLTVPFILLQSGEELRHFYESAGFQECASNSIIWLKK